MTRRNARASQRAAPIAGIRAGSATGARRPSFGGALPPPPPRQSGTRLPHPFLYGPAVMFSLLLHCLLLVTAARIAVRLLPSPPPIAVTVLDAAPPPPPPAASITAPAPAQPAPVQSQPVEIVHDDRRLEPEKPKIARRPKSRPDHPKPQQPPQSAPQPAAAAADTATGAAAPGVAGGVAGGVPGGLVGGTVGGQGRTLYRADEVARPPIPIEQKPPDYPRLARVRGVEGLVLIEAVVDQQGHVENSKLRVVESVPLLDEAALSALKEWRFTPGRDRNGDAVRVLVQVPIRFRLR